MNFPPEKIFLPEHKSFNRSWGTCRISLFSFNISCILSGFIAFGLLGIFSFGSFFSERSLSETNVLFAEDWNNWRGPSYNGISSETDLPTSWASDIPSDEGTKSDSDSSSDTSEGEFNAKISWKIEIPNYGNSTPVILDDDLFITAHENNKRLLFLRIDKKSGEILWNKEIGQEDLPKGGTWRLGQRFHEHSNLAAPSVVGDDEVVIVHFGNGETSVFKRNGERLWSKNMQKEFGNYCIWWGHSVSPLLYKDKIIMVRIEDSGKGVRPENKLNPSFIVAFDKMTGKMLWKKDRTRDVDAECGDSYATPILWEHENRKEVLVYGAGSLDAYDPETGERFWWFDFGANEIRTVPTPSPVSEMNMIFFAHGKKAGFAAVKPSGTGKQSDEILCWDYKKNIPDISCPIVDVKNNRVFIVSEEGALTCLDAESGEVCWRGRLPGGTYYASPLLADGLLYIVNMSGFCSVVNATAEKFEKVFSCQMDDSFVASPVISDGRLYLRGHKYLYCIEK